MIHPSNNMRFIVQDFRPVPVDPNPELNFHQVDGTDRIYRFYREVVEKDRGYEPEKEHVVVLALNTRGHLMGWHLVSTGGFVSRREQYHAGIQINTCFREYSL